mgnify:CR=1 FL=1
MSKISKIKKLAIILVILALACGVTISIVAAQSKSAFNLNSPVSFPVDI